MSINTVEIEYFNPEHTKWNYKVTLDDGTIMGVPQTTTKPFNRHYQDILAWGEEGNTIPEPE